MQDSFKNTFPQDGKIKLAVTGMSENGRKKWFPLPRRNKVIFHKFDLPVSTSRKKNKRILFQLNRKLGMENLFKKTFLLEGKVLPLIGITKK